MKSENLIFEALAIDNKATTSSSLGEIASKTTVSDIYIKNAIVSLLSIKESNKDATVGIVINVDLDDKWEKILLDNDIVIWKCPFDSFVMPKNFVYSLSYYKLCAFDYILNNTDFKRMCFLDCDTFGVKSFSDIWKEADNALLIIPNESSIHAPVRSEINCLYELLSGEKNKTITHFSSGFIAGTKRTLNEVMSLCREVYHGVIGLNNFTPSGGDEIIWSPALVHFHGRIHSPRAYCLLSFITISNYWLDKEFWDDPNVVMWHLPGDKRYSLIWAYDYFEKNGTLPSIKKMAAASRFRHVYPFFSYLSVKAILKDSTAIRRNLKKLWQKK